MAEYLFEVKLNNKVIMHTAYPELIPDVDECKALLRSGYKLFENGKPYKLPTSSRNKK